MPLRLQSRACASLSQVSYTDDSTAEQADTVTKGAQLSPDAEAPDDASE